jgi:Leishmanolysin
VRWMAPRHALRVLLALVLVGACAGHTCVHDAVLQENGPGSTQHVAYDNHPFESSHAHGAGSSSDAHSSASEGFAEEQFDDAPSGVPRRLFAASGRSLSQLTSSPSTVGLGTSNVYSGFAPLRIAVDWQGGVGATLLTPAALSFLRNTLLPTATAWWSSALAVQPVAAPGLNFDVAGTASSCGPASPLNGTFAADLVVRVFVSGSTTSTVVQPASPAAAAACSQYAQQCSVTVLNCSSSTATCLSSSAGLSASQQCSAQEQTCAAASAACNSAIQACLATAATSKTLTSGTLAYSSTCVRDHYSRPIVSSLNYVATAVASAANASGTLFAGAPGGLALIPQLIADANARYLLAVTLHELCHALGFSAGSVPLFRDILNSGALRAQQQAVNTSGSSALGVGLPSSLMQLPQERMYRTSCASLPASQVALQPQACVFKLATPAVTAAAAAHFGCDAAKILGAELENQDTTVGATYGSHWEERLYVDELMAPVLVFPEIFVSAETLAFFADSGWYSVNYGATAALNARKTISWGEHQGCDFALGNCINTAVTGTSGLPVASPSAVAAVLASTPGLTALQAAAAAVVTPSGKPAHFCAIPGAWQCTYDLRGMGRCAMADMGLGLEPQFAWFWETATPTAAGAFSRADYCPIVLPSASCASAAGMTSSSAVAGEVRGSDSFCVMSSLNTGGHGANGSSVNTGASASLAPGAAVYVPACYSATCNQKRTVVTITAVDASGVQRSTSCTAAQAGTPQLIPGIEGSILCPYVGSICGVAPDTCAAFKWSGTTQGVGLAAAVAFGLMLVVYTPLRVLAHTGACSGDDGDDVDSREAAKEDEKAAAKGDEQNAATDSGAAKKTSPVATYLSQVLHEHPLCRLARSFNHVAANGRRQLKVGDVVQVLTYEEAPGSIALDILLRLGTSQYLAPPPPLDTWEKRVWRRAYASHVHPAWFVVTACHERDARGAILLQLAGYDFSNNVNAPVGASSDPPAARWVPLFKACGPNGAPQPVDLSALDVDNRAKGSGAYDPYGSFGGPSRRQQSGSYLSQEVRGPSARDDPAVLTWSRYFYREHVLLPLVGNMPDMLRPAAVLATGLSGRPWRRAATLLSFHGPACLFLCALEARLLGAAQQHACAMLSKAVMSRAPAVAMVSCTLAYASRCSKRMWTHPELMSSRTFWHIWTLFTVASCAALLWALSLNVAAASGMQLLSSDKAPTALLVPGAEQFAGYCKKADVRQCASDAVRRIGITWGATLLFDLAFMWPCALVLSRHLWKDDISRWPEEEEEEQGTANEGKPANGHTYMNPLAQEQPSPARNGVAAAASPMKRDASAPNGFDTAAAAGPGSPDRKASLQAEAKAGAWD